MNIYYMDINNSLYDYNYKYFINHISDYQKNYIDNLKFYKNKKESLYSEIMLKLLLTSNYGLKSEQITFNISENGKKYLKNIPNIFFNMSHSDDKVVCCLSETEVGIDIESLRNVNICIARRFFTKGEVNFILKEVDDMNKLFFQVWTRKEAYVKANGLKLFDALCTVDIIDKSNELNGNYYIKSYEYKNNIISVCKLNRIIEEVINFYEVEINCNKELILLKRSEAYLNEINSNNY